MSPPTPKIEGEGASVLTATLPIDSTKIFIPMDLVDASMIKHAHVQLSPSQYSAWNWGVSENVRDLLSARLETQNLTVRPLKADDFSRGYLKCLAQLTVVGEITQELFEGSNNNRMFRQFRLINGPIFLL